MNIIDLSNRKSINDLGKSDANLSDVISDTRRNISKNLAVSSLAKIISSDTSDNTYIVELFPVLASEASNNSQQVKVKALEQFWTSGTDTDTNADYTNATLKEGDIVLVIFTDLNYKDSLECELAGTNADNLQYTVNDNSDTHTKNYGIIIGQVKY